MYWTTQLIVCYHTCMIFCVGVTMVLYFLVNGLHTCGLFSSGMPGSHWMSSQCQTGGARNKKPPVKTGNGFGGGGISRCPSSIFTTILIDGLASGLCCTHHRATFTIFSTLGLFCCLYPILSYQISHRSIHSRIYPIQESHLQIYPFANCPKTSGSQPVAEVIGCLHKLQIGTADGIVSLNITREFGYH